VCFCCLTFLLLDQLVFLWCSSSSCGASEQVSAVTPSIANLAGPPSLPAGAKLFYLSGMKNGKYLKREVHNLGEKKLGRLPAVGACWVHRW